MSTKPRRNKYLISLKKARELQLPLHMIELDPLTKTRLYSWEPRLHTIIKIVEAIGWENFLKILIEVGEHDDYGQVPRRPSDYLRDSRAEVADIVKRRNKKTQQPSVERDVRVCPLSPGDAVVETNKP